MAALTARIADAGRAVEAFAAIVPRAAASVETRDAAVARFIFTFEALWKATTATLYELEGIDAGSPKETVREALAVGLLSEADAEQALRMTGDRTLIVHVYKEEQATRIAARFPDYAGLARRWVEARAARRDVAGKGELGESTP